MGNKVAVLINTKDRPTELCLLLQSLRTQTYQDFDIFILDDFGGTPLNSYHFFNSLLVRIMLENHKVFVKRTDFCLGVSRARQEIVDWAKDYDYYIRVDDDCILEPDYIEQLFEVIKEGYDIASGVTIPFGPTFKRNPVHLNGIVNRVILNEDGSYKCNFDDCGMPYTQKLILPAHHFRSCALIKKEVHEKVKYYPTRLSMNGFREEQIFSYKALLNGFKIGVNTFAVNHHLATPSGGERNTMNMVPFNQKILEEFTIENKDKLKEIFKGEVSELELKKANNLIMR
jgi:glycosyltransferase involved in cell wall biosynthesis